MNQWIIAVTAVIAVIAAIIIMAYIAHQREDFATVEEKARHLTSWVARNPASPYTEYIRANPESNIVEYARLKELSALKTLSGSAASRALRI